ncbi:hypothetical protein [Nocardioides sp. TF02-7]|uniref:hypothetical protein n=1 Tax=Nocardioides sp. TF02-7 TaxID=2917724 RepID=UPI001F0612A0|nr:hypothetical protein [Nocardioides sp. TF02-7]UMG91518.1 hypothetical protein MF408_15535 [Nocardioides sp. TF02-7]
MDTSLDTSRDTQPDTPPGLVRSAGRAALGGGVLGLVSLVVVIAGETRDGSGFMSTTAAALAGWAGFVAAALLVVGLIGLAVRHAGVLPAAGRGALLLLGLATALTVGASSTLALVVPTLADRAPDLVEDPPTAVPPTFIFSGLVMGGLRDRARGGAAPRRGRADDPHHAPDRRWRGDDGAAAVAVLPAVAGRGAARARSGAAEVVRVRVTQGSLSP